MSEAYTEFTLDTTGLYAIVVGDDVVAILTYGAVGRSAQHERIAQRILCPRAQCNAGGFLSFPYQTGLAHAVVLGVVEYVFRRGGLQHYLRRVITLEPLGARLLGYAERETAHVAYVGTGTGGGYLDEVLTGGHIVTANGICRGVVERCIRRLVLRRRS